MYSYNIASTIVLLAVLRVIHGVTWAVSTTAVGTAITDIIQIHAAVKVWVGTGWR